MLVQRATHKKYNKNKFTDTDLFLYYFSGLKVPGERSAWFPMTYIYKEDEKVDILQRLISKRFFDKAKVLFSVTTPEELKQKISDFTIEGNRGYSHAFDSIPAITHHIKPENVCSVS